MSAAADRKQPVTITVMSGVEGPSVYINDLRVAGPKPWGGGSILAEFTTRTIDVAEGLVGRGAADIDVSTENALAWHRAREAHAAVALSERLHTRITNEIDGRWPS